jgi:LCP family protein required for cell wall assembly
MPPEPPRRGWWMARRFLLAALGIVVLAGAATLLLVRREIGDVLSALGQHRAVHVATTVLAPASTGEPETLLLVGNDERPPPKDNPTGAVLPHSNEMLLVRIDPSKPTISMLSIPRELRVQFTRLNGEVEENRINSAYTFGYEESGDTTSGGVKLMVETLKRVLGIPVINHVFVTNFKRFEHAVDEMGCVYMTVDKRYYHNNSEPGAEQYFEIDLQPGYQRLCGKQALEFVANRHESTSLIRDARDQRFLLDVKAQYGPTLFENREKFERILGKAVETDLHGEEEVLQLLELLVESAGKPVRQVPFQVELHSNYDTATPQQIEASVRSFLTGTAAVPRHRLSRAVRSVRGPRPGASPALSLAPTPSSTLEEARAMAGQLPFPLEAPQYQATTAEAPPDALRRYDIRDPQGQLRPTYTIVVGQGELGQYYDVQGSTWTDPPLLADPSKEIHIGSRTYSLFYDGEHVKTIAWREGDAAYWIENTLTYSLSPEAMVAIARDTRPVGSPQAPAPAAGTGPHGFVPPAPGAAPATSQGLRIAAALGFPTLAVLALLAALVLARRRELIALREQVAQALALEARQRPLLAAAARAAPRTPQPAPRIPHPAPRTAHPTPSTPHPAPRTPPPTPSTPPPTPRTTHPAPSTPHPAPSTPHPTPSTPQPAPAPADSGPPPAEPPQG